MEYGTAGNSVALFEGADRSKKSVFTYTRPDADHVVMKGLLVNDALTVKMKKTDTSKFLLLNRGFHWITEQSFNR